MNLVFEIAMWLLVASIIVYVVMNADRVAVAVGTIGTWATNEQATMVGSAPYAKAA